jgi:hypothetical protein
MDNNNPEAFVPQTPTPEVVPDGVITVPEDIKLPEPETAPEVPESAQVGSIPEELTPQAPEVTEQPAPEHVAVPEEFVPTQTAPVEALPTQPIEVPVSVTETVENSQAAEAARIEESRQNAPVIAPIPGVETPVPVAPIAPEMAPEAPAAPSETDQTAPQA